MATTEITKEEDTTIELEAKILEIDNEIDEQNTTEIKILPYDPRPHTDKARRYITYWLLTLFTILIIVSLIAFGSLFFPKSERNIDEIEKMISFILTPLITLVSSATGYYFGSQNNK